MEDTANRNGIVLKIAEFINEMNGIDTIALDLTGHNGWTDYFIITTVTSSAHLRGIYRKLQDQFKLLGINPLRRHKKIDNDSWVLIDCGDFIIHLMDREHREFYELEKLWFNSSIIYQTSKSS
ncbi:MAG TPA: ribosome silencing factor [Actinobacteria bacterium]|nr:ribosome silencing factor [Actinomycetota bacterium]